MPINELEHGNWLKSGFAVNKDGNSRGEEGEEPDAKYESLEKFEVLAFLYLESVEI